MRTGLAWVALGLIMAVPVLAAGFSPWLAWRTPVYIVAGFAGILAFALMLLQPLLAAGRAPGLLLARARRVHRWIGAGLVALVLVHVGGLWVTSPPDVVDALLFVSPTPFSAWGVLAMWALFASAGLALLRRRIGLRAWRRAHSALVVVIVAGTILHVLLIEGAMETVSKLGLAVAVGGVTAWVLWQRRVWAGRAPR